MTNGTHDDPAHDAANCPPKPESPNAGSQNPASQAHESADAKAAEETRQRIRRLPPEVGAVLITVGIAGVILPGPIGMPLLLAGGIALMPSVFGRAERWAEKRFPMLHGEGIKGVNRFIDDFERRYPPPDIAD
jgi:hypothetical protein